MSRYYEPVCFDTLSQPRQPAPPAAEAGEPDRKPQMVEFGAGLLRRLDGSVILMVDTAYQDERDLRQDALKKVRAAANGDFEVIAFDRFRLVERRRV